MIAWLAVVLAINSTADHAIIYVTGLRKNGLIAGLAKINFFPEKASTKLKYCLSALQSCAFTV